MDIAKQNNLLSVITSVIYRLSATDNSVESDTGDDGRESTTVCKLWRINCLHHSFIENSINFVQ